MAAVEIRGEDFDVEIDHDGGYEPDTNAHQIDWHFVDMTSDEREAMALTDDEEQNIEEQIGEIAHELLCSG